MLLDTVLKSLSPLHPPISLISDFKILPMGDLRTFIEQVDESSYSLKEWLETVIAFEEWSVKNARTIPLQFKLEYLYCCVQGSINEGRLISLKTVWENYINLYGVA